jgi:hypothetical protein
MAGRSQIYDEVGNGTAVDWYIPSPRILVQISEDWFVGQEFAPNAEQSFQIYDAQGGTLLLSGSMCADEYGAAGIWVGDQLDLVPGRYIVVSDGTATKDLVLEALTFDIFDTTRGFLQGTAPPPVHRRVWVGIGFEDGGWSMEVTTDPDGGWVADFGTPVPAYQWVAAQVFDPDGDVSEVRPQQVIGLWGAVFAHDDGTWTEGEHSYFFENSYAVPEPGGGQSPEIWFSVSSDAPQYDGYVVLRPFELRARLGEECSAIDPVLHPDQATRFVYGWVTDYPMTYEQALDHFDSMTVRAYWDGSESMELGRGEVVLYSADTWSAYICTYTE